MTKRVLTAFIVAALSGCAGGGARTTVAQPAGCVPANDTLVVPGCRIGPVAVGMTSADLLRVLGPPSKSQDAGSWIIHRYDSLNISVRVQRGRVEGLFTSNPRYSTRDGIRVGSTILEVTVSLGEPAWKRTTNIGDGFQTSFCFADGTIIDFGGPNEKDAGRVRAMGIRSCTL